MDSSSSPQLLFSAAEQAYVSGRLEEARAKLIQIEQLGVRHPAIHHLRAVVEQGLGNLLGSRGHFQTALRLAPNDPQIIGNFGNLLADLGDKAGALNAYERALALKPDFPDAMFNRALALQHVGRTDDARAGFRAVAEAEPRLARAWAALGDLERKARRLDAAARAFESALALQPDNRLAANGRARIALERDETDVLARYRTARALSQDDRQLAFEEAEAQVAQGDRSALDVFAQTVAGAPDWTFGQIALARMLRAAGEEDRFAAHIEDALATDPLRADLWTEYVQLLGACGLNREAAAVARRAQQAIGSSAWLIMNEAVYCGRAGDLERAGALLNTLPRNLPGRAIHDCVHTIRLGDYEQALIHLDAAFAEDRWSLSTWAIAELLFRKTDDPRSEWLSSQDGLVRTFDLPIEPDDFRAVDALLLKLHRDSAEMVGQSVRSGTQTRWQLFDRMEPELVPLRRALEQAVADYMAGLPDAGAERHPLLRHRNMPMRISGSWSVRLTGSGHHVTHFHPEGLVSSACYVRVPADSSGQEGWLELGRAPSDLLMDIEPLAAVEPRPRRLVLFPSFLYHGTRQFRAGERMTVAFDVTMQE